MEPNGLPSTRKHGGPQASSAELILQNGRHGGTSRPLGMPLTFIGRAAGCDVRLNVEGIDPLHCLLAQGPEGLVLRDLDSRTGTFVNGQRVSHGLLNDADLLSVGPFQFRLHVTALATEEPEKVDRESLRLQSAAVAAQQVALSEEEAKLMQRRAALEKQEEQLAAHLEEKRLKLLHLSERAQAERAALEKDRTAYEQRIEKVAGDMTEAQREMLDGQQKTAAERKRLAELHRRIRQRWHRFWFAERQKCDRWEEELAGTARALELREQALTEKRLRFHSLYELGRCRLREAWQRFRQDLYRWKHRRGKERAALKVRERDVESAERKLSEAQRLFINEKRAWDNARTVLATEVGGVEARVLNQRQKLVEQQSEISRLDAEILARRQQLADLPELSPQSADQRIEMSAETDAAVPDTETPSGAVKPASEDSTDSVKKEPARTATPPRVYLALQAMRDGTTVRQPAGKQAAFQEGIAVSADARDARDQRFQHLETLAGALADQRLQLVEQWRRLGDLQEQWEKDRHETSQEMDTLARRLVDRGHLVAQREQADQQAEQVLRRRHEELVQIRHQMIAWRARLRIREKAWEGERSRLLTEVRSREELADRHLNTLVDLRQRWAKRRRQELEKLRTERQGMESLRKENGQQRQLLLDQAASLEVDKRALAEKALVLEQYRKEFLCKVNNPGVERRLERLRRRWITLNATAIRAAAREREALKTALEALKGRHAELHNRADAVAQAEVDLIEKQTDWEHRQALADARQTRIQHELQSAEAQRNLSEQQVARMKEEIERIARALIDEPDPPTSHAVNQAA
jgi:pSer/pThr/pTyr-binding forkhead associated (FHA) protein